MTKRGHVTALITIRSPDSAANAALADFFSEAREREMRIVERPRGLLRRLLDAVSPDKPLYRGPVGNQFNPVPGLVIQFAEGDFEWSPEKRTFIVKP